MNRFITGMGKMLRNSSKIEDKRRIYEGEKMKQKKVNKF